MWLELFLSWLLQAVLVYFEIGVDDAAPRAPGPIPLGCVRAEAGVVVRLVIAVVLEAVFAVYVARAAEPALSLGSDLLRRRNEALDAVLSIFLEWGAGLLLAEEGLAEDVVEVLACIGALDYVVHLSV